YEGTSSFLRYQYPSSLPNHVQERLIELSHRVVGRIGLEGMTLNIEYFWDPPTDQVTLLEINPRHSHSHADLFAYVDPTPHPRTPLRLAGGEKPALPSGAGASKVAATWFLRRFTDGIVQRHPRPAEIAEIEAARPDVGIEITAHAGD